MTKENEIEAYEKLGRFYLGRRFDPDAGEIAPDPILYDSSDLTTHAVCVGMTGSGKTGLAVTLLEEALIDGVPVIAIDPKGDLGNMLLTFPDLDPSDFEPWIDEKEAAQKGRSVAEQARFMADLWTKGLAEWGQGGERIAKFKDSARAAVYVPGSTAGRGLSVLKSFAAPSASVANDADAFGDQIETTVSSILGLLGVDADPIRSREHILLSTILQHAWREGRSLDIAGMIRALQDPPVDRIGVMELDTFFPAKDRFAFAMSLNNLLASPGFSAWTQGEPLDVGRLLYTENGDPRLSILSIAHLSDQERMFFVTLLLGEILSWTRSQTGTRSLRALVYMDEVFGYFPPTANPPSKKPMLTLLKQARAYGVGIVLSTQNPVDLDYKGLSNAGTWFLGRLQTERDKARVMDGLEGASATTGGEFDRDEIEAVLSGLSSRVFLMNNVHEDGPVVFHTRWALSYLAGPMTKTQLVELCPKPEPSTPAKAGAGVGISVGPSSAESGPPVVEPEISQVYLPLSRSLEAGSRIVYRPGLVAKVTLHHASARDKVDQWKSVCMLGALRDGVEVPWEDAASLGRELPVFESVPRPNARFAAAPAEAAKAKSYKKWATMLKSVVYKEQGLNLFVCKPLKLISKPGESEGAFRARFRTALREKRDLAIEKLKASYESKLEKLEDRIERAEDKVEIESEQYSQSKYETAISIGSTIMGALFGRRRGSSASTSARRAGRVAGARSDVKRAERAVKKLREDFAELEEQLADELQTVREEHEEHKFEYTTKVIAPRKSDLSVDEVRLAWCPYAVSPEGAIEPLFVTADD